MTRFFRFVIAGSAVFSALFFCQCAFAFDDGDWQYWNTESASAELSRKWRFDIEEEFRWGDDMKNPYYNHTDIEVVYSGLADWFDLGLNYRHINEERSGGWKTEYRPHLNGTVKWKCRGFSLSNRGRLEFREREDADEAWQYRNKISVKPPMSFTKHQIQPYIADETFFDSDSKELNKNRFYSGFSFQIFKNIKAETYYLWQRSKSSSSGKWSDYNVIGTKWKLLF